MSEQDKTKKTSRPSDAVQEVSNQNTSNRVLSKPLQKEINGPKGLEPTRYGDWESKGRCSDF